MLILENVFNIQSSNLYSGWSAFTRRYAFPHLPGIDDGAKDVEASLLLIDGLIKLGYKELIATPHILQDYYPNTPQTIQKAFDQLQTEMDKRGYDIKIGFAAEYMLDDHFLNILENDELLSFGDHYVLVETMFQMKPPNLEDMIFQIQLKEYQPILAHPERYHYIDKSLTQLESLKDRNCLFQVNLLSFMGYYGKREQEIANRLLDAGMVDFIGTDMHHSKHLKNSQNFSVSRKIAKKLEQIEYKNHGLLKSQRR